MVVRGFNPYTSCSIPQITGIFFFKFFYSRYQVTRIQTPFFFGSLRLDSNDNVCVLFCGAQTSRSFLIPRLQDVFFFEFGIAPTPPLTLTYDYIYPQSQYRHKTARPQYFCLNWKSNWVWERREFLGFARVNHNPRILGTFTTAALCGEWWPAAASGLTDLAIAPKASCCCASWNMLARRGRWCKTQ